LAEAEVWGWEGAEEAGWEATAATVVDAEEAVV